MVIDVHCHVGFSARMAASDVPRFSFEENGAAGRPGYDSYFSPRLLGRRQWWFMRKWLGIDTGLEAGDALDDVIAAVNEHHWSKMSGVDRLVLLAFDEYHDDSGGRSAIAISILCAFNDPAAAGAGDDLERVIRALVAPADALLTAQGHAVTTQQAWLTIGAGFVSSRKAGGDIEENS